MSAIDYSTDQLQARAEHIRQVLDALEISKQHIMEDIVQAEELLTQHLEDTEEEIPPWEDTTPYNPAQLELPLGDPNG